jgi:hypothetical protein
MSGKKDGHLEDSVEAMAAALRHAAELQRQAEQRRREELRREAEKRFLDVAAALESQWKALRDSGFAALTGYAFDALDRQRLELARLRANDIDLRRQAAEERDALITHAVQTLKSLGERGCAGAMAALPKIQSDADLRSALAQTLAAGSAVEGFLAVIKRARDGILFLVACEAARVPLAGDVVSARAEVERFLAKPTLNGVTRAESVIAQLRPAYLEERLDSRRQALLRGIAALGDPARRPLLEAWRVGFADDLSNLRTMLGKGDWHVAAPMLRELDQFLDARAEARVRMLAGAAQAQGFKVSEPNKTAAARWTASISDQTGELFRVSEAVPQWQGGGELESSLEFNGPQNFDGPACMTSGLREICRELGRQGVALRIFHDGKEMEVGPPGRNERAARPLSATPTASASQWRKPRLDQ